VVGLHLHFGTSMPVEKGGVHTINSVRVLHLRALSLSIPRAPTNRSLFKSARTPPLSKALLSNTGWCRADQCWFIWYDPKHHCCSPVTLFTETYTAAISTSGAVDPNYPDSIEFQYGVGASVAVAPEPSTFILFGIGALGYLGSTGGGAQHARSVR
jgi:PEP-CTERM motif-containing protein